MIKIFTKQRKELKTDIDTRIVEYVTYKVGVAIKYQEVKKNVFRHLQMRLRQ